MFVTDKKFKKELTEFGLFIDLNKEEYIYIDPELANDLKPYSKRIQKGYYLPYETGLFTAVNSTLLDDFEDFYLKRTGEKSILRDIEIYFFNLDRGYINIKYKDIKELNFAILTKRVLECTGLIEYEHIQKIFKRIDKSLSKKPIIIHSNNVYSCFIFSNKRLHRLNIQADFLTQIKTVHDYQIYEIGDYIDDFDVYVDDEIETLLEMIYC